MRKGASIVTELGVTQSRMGHRAGCDTGQGETQNRDTEQGETRST